MSAQGTASTPSHEPTTSTSAPAQGPDSGSQPDAGPQPDAGTQPDAGQPSDAAAPEGGDAGPAKPEDAGSSNIWESLKDTEESGSKQRPWRQRRGEAMALLADIPAKYQGIIRAYDDRFKDVEKAVGSISLDIGNIRTEVGNNHTQVLNTLATEESSIRDYIRQRIEAATDNLRREIRNEIAGEQPAITDRIVEILAKRDQDRDAMQAERDAATEKKLQELYNIVQYQGGATNSLKSELIEKTNGLGKQIESSAADVEKQQNAAFAQVSKIEDRLVDFERNMAKFLGESVAAIKSWITSSADSLTMEGIQNRERIEDMHRHGVDEILTKFSSTEIRLEEALAKNTEVSAPRTGQPAQQESSSQKIWAAAGELHDDPIDAEDIYGPPVQQRKGTDIRREVPPHMEKALVQQAPERPQQPGLTLPGSSIADPTKNARHTAATTLPSAAAAPAQHQQVLIPQGYQLVPLQPQTQQRPERIKFKDAKHFSGADDQDVDLWLNEVTSELRYGGRTDQEIIDGLPILLEGSAKRWLNRLTLAQRSAIQGWDTAGGWQDALRLNFRRTNYENVMRQKLTQMRWSDDQKFSDYFEKRSELQTVCCAGYDDAALIEDMLSGMAPTDQAEARKEARRCSTLLEWKRAMVDVEPTIRERHDILKQVKEMERRMGQLAKTSSTPRRSSNWIPRFGTKRAEGTTAEQQPSTATRATTSGKSPEEKQTVQRPAFQRLQRPEGQVSNFQPRTARAQVASVDDGDEDEQDDAEFANEPFDDDAEADFVDCLMADATVPHPEARRSSRLAQQRAPNVQAQNQVPDQVPESAVGLAPERNSGNSDETSEPSYLNKLPAFVSAHFAEDDSKSQFRVCADTGSSITLMDKGVIKRFFSHIPPKNERLIQVKGVGGQTAISQSISLQMTLQDTAGERISIRAKFYINPAEDMRIILGNDFMEHYGATIDIGNQLMTLSRNVGERVKIALSSRRDKTPLMKAAEAFVIRPYHRALIPVKLDGGVHSETIYLDPLPLQNGLVAVSARRGVALTKGKPHFMEVYNLDPWPYRFEAGETIARALALEDVSTTDGESYATETTGSAQETRKDVARFREALAELDINPSLSPKERQRITDVLIEHRKAFAYGDRPLGRTNLGKVRIDTGDAAPVSTPPFRVSPEGRRLIEQEVVRLLASDVIEEADSPWAANVVLIKQKSKIRFCVDYRKLNAVTKTDQYPLPRIDDYLNQFQGKRYFSTFDANSGFNQVEIDERDREKTAFRTHVGLYQYKRMPFGIKNGPSIFQRCMDKALGTTKWQFAVVYIDDIVVYSADFETHLRHVATILGRIIPTGFTLSLSKSHLCYQEIHALGHKVSQLGIGMKGENVKAILAYPRPTSTKQIQVFLGMAGYYRRFIKNFASIARPLTKLLAKDQTFRWTEECQTAFETLRSKLSEEPILAHPDYEREFIVYTDASTLGIGGVLAQKDDNGREHIVCAISKALEERERRLSATELECLALVWAMRQFRPYIDGVKSIRIITDHAALQWIYDYKGSNRKLQRWSLDLQPWRDVATIVHRPGRTHSNVDALSRSSDGQTSDEITVQTNDVESETNNVEVLTISV